MIEVNVSFSPETSWTTFQHLADHRSGTAAANETRSHSLLGVRTAAHKEDNYLLLTRRKRITSACIGGRIGGGGHTKPTAPTQPPCNLQQKQPQSGGCNGLGQQCCTHTARQEIIQSIIRNHGDRGRNPNRESPKFSSRSMSTSGRSKLALAYFGTTGRREGSCTGHVDVAILGPGAFPSKLLYSLTSVPSYPVCPSMFFEGLLGCASMRLATCLKQGTLPDRNINGCSGGGGVIQEGPYP